MTSTQTTPRLPMSETTLNDFARHLLEGRFGRTEYGDLAELIQRGPEYGINPKAITVARDRLTAAAERGSASAKQHLASINKTEQTR